LSGLWQLAHDWRPEAESDTSLKIFSPSAAWAESAASSGTPAFDAELPPPPHAASSAVDNTATLHANDLWISTLKAPVVIRQQGL
jgi:hypothetical protein